MFKNTSIDQFLQECMERIPERDSNYQKPKVKVKIPLDQMAVPTYLTYKDLQTYHYNITHLKSIAKHYNLKQSGNKIEVLNRMYNYLCISHYVVKIQKNARRYLVRAYVKMHGPAAFHRSLCNNLTDFVSMEPVEEIDFHQFMSYKDIDDFIYGFDILSLRNLFLKSSGEVKNPYNRNIVPKHVIKNLCRIIRFGKILNIPIQLDFECKTITAEKTTESRAFTLFQTINEWTNQTSSSNWFMHLNRSHLREFIYELVVMWNYRCGLSLGTKKKICPPHGNPFHNIRIDAIVDEPEITNAQNTLLTILEQMVYNGVDNDSKTLGSMLVLGVITLVNASAASSIPWLFESFSYR